MQRIRHTEPNPTRKASPIQRVPPPHPPPPCPQTKLQKGLVPHSANGYSRIAWWLLGINLERIFPNPRKAYRQDITTIHQPLRNLSLNPGTKQVGIEKFLSRTPHLLWLDHGHGDEQLLQLAQRLRLATVPWASPL